MKAALFAIAVSMTTSGALPVAQAETEAAAGTTLSESEIPTVDAATGFASGRSE